MKHKKRQLEDTLKMVEKKRKEQGEATSSVMFSHLPPQGRRAGEEELKPEDSVYYHPTLNPTGAPPRGKPPKYHSSIGTRIYSDGASSSGAALSCNTESEDSALVAPPLPDGTSHLSASLPLPPPPPLPPTTGLTLPHSQFPPPMMRPPLPPGPPPSSFEDSQAMMGPYVPTKPSYVKSAAPTLVRRPLAQHTPALTSMLPASVRVRRESAAVTKPNPKTSVATSLSFKPRAMVAPVKVEPKTKTAAASKPPSMDDSYSAFLEDMKALDG